MIFASTTLAARLEQAEARLVSDATHATSMRRPGAQTFILKLGGGVATYAGPGSPLNKVAGMGFAGPLDEAELAAVEQAYARHRSPVQVELSCLAEAGIGAMLTRRGYILAGFENVLGRELVSGVPVLTGNDVAVAKSDDAELPLWLDTVVTGFATPDAQGVPAHEEFPRDVLERVISDLTAAPGFTRYLARRGSEVAGGASLRMSEGVATLSGAATLPAHRRRGVQTALLARRLADAARAGCDLAVVTTLPGSRSQQNVQARGFELLYTRAILVRAPG